MTPTPTQALEPVEVTQAARDVSMPVMLWLQCDRKDGEDHYREAHLDGDNDEHFIVQAFARFERDTFARHRQSSNAASEPMGNARKFKLGDQVYKKSGANWRGKVVGFYSTDLTSVGYAVESDTEKGSVQIYPEKALALSATPPAQKGEQ